MKAPIVIRRTCEQTPCCHQDQGTCCCGNHRDDAMPAGSLVASPAEPLSWLAERPWIWFWVAFLVMIVMQTTLIVIATKNQPASVPLRTISNHG